MEPGNPDQNAIIERFNQTCREEVLAVSERWGLLQILQRPHDSLGEGPR